MEDKESVALLKRWQSGDQQAAEELFRRYAERLIGLARGRLSEKLARRLDAEDVVQSAYRSFFIGARAGRYALAQSGDLWRLLVSIVLHKLHGQVERHTAGKRSPDREEVWPGSGDLLGLPGEPLLRQPSVEEAVALADEVERLMGLLSPLQRQVLERRLQDYTLDEIAADLKCSQRTVRRVMEQIRQFLEYRQRE
jgi:RNA polymerase sigma factor (sigma-70 family)